MPSKYFDELDRLFLRYNPLNAVIGTGDYVAEKKLLQKRILRESALAIKSRRRLQILRDDNLLPGTIQELWKWRMANMVQQWTDALWESNRTKMKQDLSGLQTGSLAAAVSQAKRLLQMKNASPSDLMVACEAVQATARNAQQQIVDLRSVVDKTAMSAMQIHPRDTIESLSSHKWTTSISKEVSRLTHRPCLRVTVKQLELTCLDTYKHRLGPWHVEYSLFEAEAIGLHTSVRVYGGPGAPLAGNYCHPNVGAGGDVCFGNYRYAAVNSMLAGDLVGLHAIVCNLLSTYGSDNPYTELRRFRACTDPSYNYGQCECERCGAVFDGEAEWEDASRVSEWGNIHGCEQCLEYSEYDDDYFDSDYVAYSPVMRMTWHTENGCRIVDIVDEDGRHVDEIPEEYVEDRGLRDGYMTRSQYRELQEELASDEQ